MGPQGSILWLLLLNLYDNGLPRVDRDLQEIMHADDSSFLLDIMGNDVDAVVDWLNA